VIDVTLSPESIFGAVHAAGAMASGKNVAVRDDGNDPVHAESITAIVTMAKHLILLILLIGRSR
jgi:hypothetical protein